MSLRFRTISTPYRPLLINAPPWNRSTHSRPSQTQWCRTPIWSGRKAIWIKVSNHIQVKTSMARTRARQPSTQAKLSIIPLRLGSIMFKSRAFWHSQMPLVYLRRRCPVTLTSILLVSAHLPNMLRWIKITSVMQVLARKQPKVNSIRSCLLNSSTNKRSAMASSRSRTSRCTRSYARRWNKAYSVNVKPLKTPLTSLMQWVSTKGKITLWGKLSPIST